MSKVYLPGGRAFRHPEGGMAVTASHTTVGALAWPIGYRAPDPSDMVRNRLKSLHGKFGSWRAVSTELGGLNPALLCRIAAGKQAAPKSVRAVLLPPQWAKDAADWMSKREKNGV